MNNPFASDGNLIDPQAEDTRGFLRIAVSAANGPNATKKVKLTPAAVKAFLIRLAEEPEGRQVWDGYGKGPKKPPVSLTIFSSLSSKSYSCLNGGLPPGR